MDNEKTHPWPRCPLLQRPHLSLQRLPLLQRLRLPSPQLWRLAWPRKTETEKEKNVRSKVKRKRKRKRKVKASVKEKSNKWTTGSQAIRPATGLNHGSISLTLRFGAGLLCGAETSVFLPILANFQWFLAKNWQFLFFLTRKRRSDFFRVFFSSGFGSPRTS